MKKKIFDLVYKNYKMLYNFFLFKYYCVKGILKFCDGGNYLFCFYIVYLNNYSEVIIIYLY